MLSLEVPIKTICYQDYWNLTINLTTLVIISSIRKSQTNNDIFAARVYLNGLKLKAKV